MKAVAYLVEAEEELDGAIAASDVPDEFRAAVAIAIQDVASGLFTAAPYPRTPCRRLILTRFPYSLVYAETATEIRVIAFPHHRQRPGYWKYRLRPKG